MGHRANLLIAEHHTYSLYYIHWCGISITQSTKEHLLQYAIDRMEDV